MSKAVERRNKKKQMSKKLGNKKIEIPIEHLLVYAGIMDNETRQNKDAISGQMSLFDMVGEEDKSEYEVSMPEVAEYTKEELLNFEKEVLGVYVSGHPLDEYNAMWKKHISAVTTDFEIDEETGETKVREGSKQTIGGMVMNKTVKMTKTGQPMAFLTLEDLVGTVEVIVFPKDYTTYRAVLDSSDKLFITGRVSANLDENAKLVCERIVSFDEVPRKLWIRFADEAEYHRQEQGLLSMLEDSDGHDKVIVYCTAQDKRRLLPDSRNIKITAELLAQLRSIYGDKNVETT